MKEIKKILATTIVGFILMGLIVPALALAQIEGPADCCVANQTFSAPNGNLINEGDVIGADGGYCSEGTPSYDEDDWAVVCLLNTTINVTNWTFYILVILSVLFVIAGGFVYMISGGDPDKASKGKSLIVYAMIGIVIAIFARIIPAIVKFVI